MEKTVPEPTVKISKPAKKHFPWKKAFLVIVLGLIGLLVALVLFILTHPALTLARSFIKLARYDSLRVKYVLKDGNELALEGNFHKDGLSETTFKIEGDQMFDFKTRFDKKNLYFNSNLLSLPETLALTTLYPPFFQTQAYRETVKFLGGDSWLHVVIPETDDKTETAKTGAKMTIKEAKNLFDGFRIFRFNRTTNRFDYNGTTYKKVAVGVNKKQLLTMIEKLKDTDLDIKVSQINSFKKIVESTDGFEGDLFSFLLDKDGNLAYILLAFPTPDKTAVNSAIDEQTKDNPTLSSLTSLKDSFMSTFSDKKETQLTQVGVISFFDYGQASAVERPTKLVESTILFELYKTEVVPMIPDIVALFTNPQAKTTTPTTTTNKTNTPKTVAGGMSAVNATAEMYCWYKNNTSATDVVFYQKATEIGGKYGMTALEVATYLQNLSVNKIPSNELVAISSKIQTLCP